MKLLWTTLAPLCGNGQDYSVLANVLDLFQHHLYRLMFACELHLNGIACKTEIDLKIPYGTSLVCIEDDALLNSPVGHWPKDPD